MVQRQTLRSAVGEVERRRRGASSEAQPERNAAAEPQTEARRSCGTVRMPLVTSARFEQRNRRGREGSGPADSLCSGANRALVTANTGLADMFVNRDAYNLSLVELRLPRFQGVFSFVTVTKTRQCL